MKRLLLLSVLALSVVYLTLRIESQKENHSVGTGIQGHWRGIAPDKSNIEYTFSADGQVVWTVGKHSIHAKFKTKHEAKLTQIDIFEFEQPQLEGFSFLGIAEITKSKMKFYGIPSSVGKSPDGRTVTRPTAFGNDTIIFNRVEEGNGTPQNLSGEESTDLPFQVTEVRVDSERNEANDIKSLTKVLIGAKDYGKLDELAGKYRSSKECYSNGAWKLGDIYAQFVPSEKSSSDEWEDCIVSLKEWISVNQKSITARVGLANVLVNYAWKARGSGWAKTVKDSDWRLFEERLNQAMAILNEAETLELQCPHYWTVKMRAGLGLRVDKAHINQMFDQAKKYDSRYEPSYLQRAIYLMPRWHGSEGELEADLEKSADQLGGDDGDMLYAQVVWGIHSRASSPNVFKENNFSWHRVDRGFSVIEKRFPNSLAAKSERAYLAAYAGDGQKARAYFKETQGEVDLAIWGSKEEYIRIANWAFKQ